MTKTGINDKRRHELLGLPFSGQRYDCSYYRGLDAPTLKTLISEGFADPSERENDSPDINEILEFLEANPDFRAHGYIITPLRDDCRVSIEGVEAPYCTTKERDAFIEMFRHADEFTLEPPRAWYD